MNAPLSRPAAPEPVEPQYFRSLTRSEVKDPAVLLLPIAEQLLRVIGSTDDMHPMVADSRRKTIALVAADVTLLYLDLAGVSSDGAPGASELQRFGLAVAAGVPVTLLRRAWGKR